MSANAHMPADRYDNPGMGDPSTFRHLLACQCGLLGAGARTSAEILRVQGTVHLRASVTYRVRGCFKLWHPEKPGVYPQFAQRGHRWQERAEGIQNSRSAHQTRSESSTARGSEMEERARRTTNCLLVLLKWHIWFAGMCLSRSQSMGY